MTEQHAAADYILKFASNVEQLNVAYMNYINYVLETTITPELSDDQKQARAESINNLRGFAILCGIQTKAISNKLKIPVNIDEHLKKIKGAYTISDDIEQYVSEINKFLINNILQSLLETSLEIAGKVSQ